MSNVTSIKTEKPSDVIASSLRAMADQISRAGTATRALLIVGHREPGIDKQEMIFLGTDASVIEIVGMLEVAKHEAISTG